MTTTADTARVDARRQFQTLLRELFQFDSADLDFGIYRIMNHKRAVVEDFIANKLPAEIAAALASGPLVVQTQAQERLEAAARQVRETLAEYALNDSGELDDHFRDTYVGQAYLAAQQQAASGRSRAALETDIYNGLYNFFRRYYQDGDFIAQRRYSGSGDTYAIPYNGQEVYLHWANRDQYYVKTAEHFFNYDWKAANGVTVQFRLQTANIEQNNVKGDKRFFLPQADQLHWDADQRILTIPMEYRPLTPSETAQYGSRQQQDNILKAAATDIPAALSHQPEPLAALTAVAASGKTNLETHLRRYTARNNADFFIHKNLAAFLHRELDFYLKNETLNLDHLLTSGPQPAAADFQKAQLMRQIGRRIIAFLGQLEAFQKSLWEKRKFVTQTHYCLTLGCINQSFYPEIAANAAQWQEWQNLGFIPESFITPPPIFLSESPTLPLDTRHFPPDFTDRLLASFTDLNAKTDGILIHSDNWQALRLLGETYQGQVKAVYIDPPYNTKMAPILYKNDYKDSSWMSLVGQGLAATVDYMTDSGVICVAIDDEEKYNLKNLIDTVVGAQLYAGTVVVQANPGGRDINTHLATSHDYCLLYANPGQGELRLPRQDMQAEYQEGPFRRTGGLSAPDVRPNSEFAFYYNPDILRIVGVGGKRVDQPPALYEPAEIHIWDEKSDSPCVVEPEDFFNRHPNVETIVPLFTNGDRGVWRWSDREKIVAAVKDGNIFLKQGKNSVTVTLRSLVRPTFKPKTIWADSKYSATTYGTILLQNMFGSKGEFTYPKSLYTVKDTIEASTYGVSDSIALDYFAGSGTTAHAVINLNREDANLDRDADTRRRFILVEQGDYFATVLLPRIKKAIYAPEWAAGQPKRPATPDEAARSPRIIKYLRLESYEDALDSIDFDAPAGELALAQLGDEYLLKYMLNWETKDSPTRLKAAELNRPFDYELQVRERGEIVERKVDLPETFNWLLGLLLQTRQVYHRDGIRYLVYTGETRSEPGQKTVVIWRETAGWAESDYAADRDFIAELPEVADAAAVYLNGNSALNQTGSRAIEPLFKERMFAGVEES